MANNASNIREGSNECIDLKVLEASVSEQDFDDEKQYLEPYQNTINKLTEMQWIQCPVNKINHIYNCLKFDLADEIDEFYNFCEQKMEEHIAHMSMKLTSTDLVKNNMIDQEQLYSNLHFNKKERVMDIDNLQGICIFMVY